MAAKSIVVLAVAAGAVAVPVAGGATSASAPPAAPVHAAPVQAGPVQEVSCADGGSAALHSVPAANISPDPEGDAPRGPYADGLLNKKSQRSKSSKSDDGRAGNRASRLLEEYLGKKRPSKRSKAESSEERSNRGEKNRGSGKRDVKKAATTADDECAGPAFAVSPPR
jgi:hypothetical protein